jgi:manganese efflux pump family protein
MGWIELLAVALALAMDAFAVAVVVGLTVKPITAGHLFRLPFHFGLFQAVMPILGWTAGMAVQQHVASIDHWVAFGLLALVGGRMVWGALGAEPHGTRRGDPTRGWQLVMLATATSIDALAVGLSLAMLGCPIAGPAVVIGLVAGALTLAGMQLGQYVGSAWGRRVELLGGLVLVAIGVKIVLDHTL